MKPKCEEGLCRDPQVIKLTEVVVAVKESQIRIEQDIKHHIKRTDLLEDMVKPVYKAHQGIKWAGILLISLGAIASAILKIKGIF